MRKNVQNLTEQEVIKLRTAYSQIMQITDNRGYAYLAGYHGVPGWYCWHHALNTRTLRRARLFLPWHRAYLYRFELALQDQDPEVNIPYWDWTSELSRSEGIPAVYGNYFVDGSQENPLSGFHINVPFSTPPLDEDTLRSPSSPQELPTPQDVAQLFTLNDYGDFNDGLEDIHDRIHAWVGGSMGEVAKAAYDPIFYAHHAMIDRIWYLWQLEVGNSRMPPNIYDIVLEPFGLTVRDVLNIYDLGYDYAAAQVIVEG